MVNEYRVLIYNLEAGSNGLLGEFNVDNKYDIANNLKQELTKANKLINSYKPDKICAVATIGSYTFNFVVYVQLGEQNKKRLSLFLEEKGKFFDEDKEFLTLLSSIIIEGSQNLLEVIKKEFAMYIADESTGIDMSNSNLTTVVQQKDKTVKRSKFLQGELKTLNKAYVLKILSLVKTSEYGNQFLLQFKDIIKNKNVNKNDDKYWNKLKNILDKMLLENESLFDGKLNQRIEDLQKGYIHMVLNAKEPIAIKPEDKKPKKEEDKKKPPKKAAPPKKKGADVAKTAEPLRPVKIINGGIFTTQPSSSTRTSPTFNLQSQPLVNDNKPAGFSNLMAPIFDKELDRGKRKEEEKTKKPKIKSSDDGRSL